MLKRFFVLTMVAALAFGCRYDDADLWNSVDDLENRVTSLEEKVKTMNGQVVAIRELVDASTGVKTISEVNTAPHGYDILFSDGSSVQIKHGTSAQTPVMGAKKDVDDIYYWTVTIGGLTEFLEDGNGGKLKVSGNTPVMGVDAEGCWTVDCGEGAEPILDLSGNPIKASAEESIASIKNVDFKSDDDNVIFTLQDDSTIAVPKTGSTLCKIDCSEYQYLLYGETRTFDLTMGEVENMSIAKPDGWKVSLAGDKLTVKAPLQANAEADFSGVISIIAFSGSRTTITNLNVAAADYNRLVSFEEKRVEDYLAGPTSAGKNLYSSYAGADRYYGYDDAESGLMMTVTYGFDWDSYEDDYNFYNGGVAISRWNDMTTPGDGNQCSVYYRDPVTGYGGNNGSRTFATLFDGSDMGGMMGPSYDYNVYVGFADGDKERSFKHIHVNNATYAALAMKNGYGMARALDHAHNDWLLLTITGLDSSGDVTASAEVYLADFRSPGSPGIMTEWTKVDLTALGAVNRLQFKITGSDSGGGYLNTPAYVCFDDLAFVE